MSTKQNCTYVANGPTDFLVKIISCYASKMVLYCYRNHHATFEIDKTILACLNFKKIANQYGLIVPNYRNDSLLKR